MKDYPETPITKDHFEQHQILTLLKFIIEGINNSVDLNEGYWFCVRHNLSDVYSFIRPERQFLFGSHEVTISRTENTLDITWSRPAESHWSGYITITDDKTVFDSHKYSDDVFCTIKY